MTQQEQKIIKTTTAKNFTAATATKNYNVPTTTNIIRITTNQKTTAALALT